MVQLLKNAMVALALISYGSVCVVARGFQPDPARLSSMMLAEKSTGDVDDSPYLNYLDSLGFMKSDTDIALGLLRRGEIFYIKALGEDTVQVEVRAMKKINGKISRSIKIKTTSDSIIGWMVSQLKAFGMEVVNNSGNFQGLSGKGLVAGYSSNILIVKCDFTPSSSNELPCVSDDGKGRMDASDSSIIARIEIGNEIFSDTLVTADPGIDVYPKHVYSFLGKGGTTMYLFIYSTGHLFFYDEATVYAVRKDGSVERQHFVIKNQREPKIGCMWWDQMVAASSGFPYEYDDSPDEDTYGIHFMLSLRSLYVPIMESHDPDSEFYSTNCLRYTGRFDVFRFNGTDFVYGGTDGAWWLNPDLRNYKRTISNRLTADGIEQIDLLPDGSYRTVVWKEAETLYDLRKKPDEVKYVKKSPQ